MTQQNDDRRRYLRLGPEGNVFCSIQGADVLHVVGISSDGSGMRIISDRELPAHEQFQVVIDPQDGNAPIEGRARAVWQEVWDFEFCSRHVAGLALLDLGQSDRERLLALIPERTQPMDEDQL